jgi:endonuclease YncB( thermonuclease family)
MSSARHSLLRAGGLPLRIAAAGALLALLAQAGEVELGGRASVIDGDTLEIRGRRVRLRGIDAPETSQTCDDRGKPWRCGQQAALALDAKIAGRSVACTDEGSDRYGRLLGTCSVGGENLNRWLVAQGWALAYRRYTEAYVAEEEAAKTAHLGVWRGSFTAPWDYRADGRSRPRAPAAQPPPRCAIKGNINRDGEKIYHLPASPAYARTHINTRAGERYFCTEAEARAAGWRPAQVPSK